MTTEQRTKLQEDAKLLLAYHADELAHTGEVEGFAEEISRFLVEHHGWNETDEGRKVDSFIYNYVIRQAGY